MPPKLLRPIPLEVRNLLRILGNSLTQTMKYSIWILVAFAIFSCEAPDSNSADLDNPPKSNSLKEKTLEFTASEVSMAYIEENSNWEKMEAARTFIVTGKVTKIELDPMETYHIVLSNDDSSSEVICHGGGGPGKQDSRFEKIKEGDALKLKGMCMGQNVLSVVTLVNCELVD